MNKQPARARREDQFRRAVGNFGSEVEGDARRQIEAVEFMS
jgi:hypothetical protein